MLLAPCLQQAVQTAFRFAHLFQLRITQAITVIDLECAVGLALLLGNWITNESPIKNPHPFGQAPSVHILTLR